MTYQRRIGAKGEQLAVTYLQKQGYLILDQNFNTRFGELDLVAQKENALIFVEVKTRTTTTFGLPEDSVTPSKLERIANAGLIWLQEHPEVPDDWRIDVIAILLKEDQTIEDIRHFKNAY